MKLPRYSSTALPREVNISPQMAGQAAATRGQLVTQATTAASEFTFKLYQAQQQANVDSAVAKAQMQAKQWVEDPQWDRPTTEPREDFSGRIIEEGKPTEEVKLQQWGSIKNSMSDGVADIKGRYKKAAETQIAQIQFEAELEAAKKVDQILIDRGKNTTNDTIVTLQDMGDYAGARQAIINGTDSGFLSPAERAAKLHENSQMQKMEPYADALTSGNPNAVAAAAADVRTRTDIDPDKRTDLYKQLIAAEKQIEADEQADPIREENYMRMLPGTIKGDVGIDQIIDAQRNGSLSDTRFDYLITIAKGRQDSKSGGSLTNSVGQKRIDDVTRRVMLYGVRDELTPYNEMVDQAKLEIMSDGNVSTDDADAAVKRLDALLKVQRDNPMYRQMLDVERAAITGVTGSGIFTVTVDTAEEARIYQEMELEFYEEAERKGPLFEPKKWLNENRTMYRMNAVEKIAEKGNWSVVKTADGKGIDMEATQQSIFAAANTRINLADKSKGFAGENMEEKEAAARRWVAKQYERLQAVSGIRP